MKKMMMVLVLVLMTALTIVSQTDDQVSIKIGTTGSIDKNEEVATFGFIEDQDILVYIDLNIYQVFTLNGMIAQKGFVDFDMLNYYSINTELYNSRIKFGFGEYFNDSIKAGIYIQSSLTPQKVTFDGFDAFIQFIF